MTFSSGLALFLPVLPSLFETVAVTTLLLASIKFSGSLKAYGSSSSSLDVVVEVAARRPRPPNGVVSLPFEALDFGGGFVPAPPQTPLHYVPPTSVEVLFLLHH